MEPTTGPTKATKAVFGGISAICAAVATIFADGQVTVVECALAAAGVVATIGIVYGVTNDPVTVPNNNPGGLE